MIAKTRRHFRRRGVMTPPVRSPFSAEGKRKTAHKGLREALDRIAAHSACDTVLASTPVLRKRPKVRWHVAEIFTIAAPAFAGLPEAPRNHQNHSSLFNPAFERHPTMSACDCAVSQSAPGTLRASLVSSRGSVGSVAFPIPLPIAAPRLAPASAPGPPPTKPPTAPPKIVPAVSAMVVNGPSRVFSVVVFTLMLPSSPVWFLPPVSSPSCLFS